MNSPDSTELLALCESIVSDGEVSGDEIYDLSTWLNEHPDACLCWPGDQLVKPLQEVWADGKITKTELRVISRLLLRIRKEWAKRQSAAAVGEARELAQKIVSSMDLREPRLPVIPVSACIMSHSQKGVLYDVDLSGPSCTCADWRSYRAHLPDGHLTRCCKHVFDAYRKIEPEDGWPGWLGAYLDNAYTPHPKKEWMIVPVGRAFALASTAPIDWADVFAESLDEFEEYHRFGYHVGENRWSYGDAPKGSKKIISAIVSGGNF